MITDNPQIDHGKLRALVRSAWGVPVGDLDFLTVGGDSWSYRSGEWYVNVRDGLNQRDGLGPPRDVEPSYAAAVTLRERCGLDFLLAPTRTREGRSVARLGRFAVTVAPYVEGDVSLERFTRDQLVQAIGWIERLHAATSAVAGLGLLSEDFVADFADALPDALDRACGRGERGPYSTRVRDLLVPVQQDVLGALAAHTALGERLRARGYEPVVTHGEPSSSNVLEAADGRRWLVDLSQILIGPRERDLFHLRQDAPPGGDEMLAGPPDDATRFYDASYDLGEVTEYTNRLACPHTGDPEDERAWDLLLEYLPRALGR